MYLLIQNDMQSVQFKSLNVKTKILITLFKTCLSKYSHVCWQPY